MQKSPPAKWPTQFARIVLLFSALFCVWGGMSLFATRGIPILYALVAPNIYVVLFTTAALGLSLLALMIVRIFRKFWVGLFVVAVVFSCAGLYSLLLGSMEHQDSIAFKGRVYYLALRDDAQWSDYVLCECDGAGLMCRCQSFYSRYSGGRPRTNTFSVDEATNELHVNAGKDVIYKLGATSQCFSVDGYCTDK
jgi:hypothetical protein